MYLVLALLSLLFFVAWHLREICLSYGDDFDLRCSCTQYRKCQARLPRSLATRPRCKTRVTGAFMLETLY